VTFKIVILAASLSLIFVGCKGGSSTRAEVASESKTTGPLAGSSPAGGASQQSAPEPGPTPRQVLLGVYSISEVDYKVKNRNAVDMIPPNFREIQISFREDGQFMRVSWKDGLVTLSETGTFKVEAPDKLVLTPAVVNKKDVTDGRKTSYRFALSDEGEELRLWGARGNVAVFRRTKKF